MQIKENTSIHPGKISLGVGRYALVIYKALQTLTETRRYNTFEQVHGMYKSNRMYTSGSS